MQSLGSNISYIESTKSVRLSAYFDLHNWNFKPIQFVLVTDEILPIRKYESSEWYFFLFELLTLELGNPAQCELNIRYRCQWAVNRTINLLRYKEHWADWE